MNFTVRKMNKNEYPLLSEFLYLAIFIPEGVAAPPRDIINRPELAVYIEDFGKHPHDTALCAESDGKIVGAVWVRIMNDYGHIDDDTPSFAISVIKDHRKNGIGTALMEAMLRELKNSGFSKASLAVQKANYAVKMYRKLGFVTVSENDEEFIMSCDLTKTDSSPVIRKLNVSDYGGIYKLWLSCKGMGLNTSDDSEEGISKFLARNPETCFAAVENGRIVGAVLAGNDGRRGYIYHLAVSPGCRRRGIASMLVDSVMKAFESVGITKAALVVFSRNSDGNDFWEKKGFSVRDDLTYRNKAVIPTERIDT